MSAVTTLGAVLQELWARWYILIPSIIVARAVYLRFFHPLANVPGPFFASISQGWLIYHAVQGEQHLVQVKCHEKYGQIFRAGPNSVLIADPQFAQQYYAWDRSDWWTCFIPRPGNTATNFTRNYKEHNAKKKRVTGAYTMSSVIQKEPSMDEIIVQFLQHLRTRFASTGKTVDMAYWTQFAAFDIVMEMAFSSPFGFIHHGEDVNGIIASLHQLTKLAQVLGLIPIVMKIFLNPHIYPWVGPKPTDKSGPGAVIGISERVVDDRFAHGNPKGQRDVLQIMTEYRDQNGQGIAKDVLQMECLSPVLAGSDTTASSLRVAVLYIATNTVVRRKVVTELEDAERAGLLSSPAKFNQLKELHYLPAVIKEVIRILPVVGGPMWRSVPTGGKSLYGYYLPGGTEIGMNVWALSRNKAVYGEDAAIFRPERWLEDPKKVREWEKVDAYFGMGNYMCLGKNIAMMELYKITAELFRNFDIVVSNPSDPWKQFNALAFACKHFDCQIYTREKK